MTSKVDILRSRIKNNDVISEVDLSNSDLSQLPSELFELAHSLEFLNIGGNKLSQLPANFSIFTKLRILFAPNNLFTELPSVLGKLSSLYMLSFKSNQISSIPEDSLSPSIGWLILTGNQIPFLPNSIGNLLPLRKLMLAGNRIQSLPLSLAKCINLELIRLACNQLTSIPDFLLQMPKLSWIALSGNPGLTVPLNSSSSSCNVNSSSDINPYSDEDTQKLLEYSWNDLIIGNKLGEGASGTVYKATWKSPQQSKEGDCNGKTHEAVAIKLFKGENTSDGSPEDEMRACVAAGSHPSSIGVIGRLKDTPNNQLGLILELVPATFTILGQPPSFTSVTRDCYPVDTTFPLSFILHIASHISQVSAHLHARGINHGDLYAHNILVDRVDLGLESTTSTTSTTDTSTNAAATSAGNTSSSISTILAWRPPLLGDFGAASFYNSEIFGGPVASMRFQKCEVRAFGCLLEELLDRISYIDTVYNSTSLAVDDADADSIITYKATHENSITSTSTITNTSTTNTGSTSLGANKRVRSAISTHVDTLKALVQECMNREVDGRPTFQIISQRLQVSINELNADV